MVNFSKTCCFELFTEVPLLILKSFGNSSWCNGHSSHAMGQIWKTYVYTIYKRIYTGFTLLGKIPQTYTFGSHIWEVWPFSVWCPVKGHTYLNKPAAISCRFV